MVDIAKILSPRQFPFSGIQPRQLMASPPTPTWSTSHTIASPLRWPATFSQNTATVDNINGVFFNYFGAYIPNIYAATSPSYNYVGFSDMTFVNATKGTTAYQISFYHYGQTIELDLLGANGSMLVMVDGKFISLSEQSIAGDNASHYYYIDFGSVDLRRLDVMVTGSAWGGVYTPVGDNIFPAGRLGPRLGIIGDSWSAGTGASSVLTSWPRILQNALGWSDVFVNGQGGTGYLTASGNNGTYASRMADMIAARPDIMMWTGGMNDRSGFSAAAIAAEMASEIAAMRAAKASCIPVVVAPFWGGGASTIPSLLALLKDALQVQAAASGALWLDITEQPLPSYMAGRTSTIQNTIASNATALVMQTPSAPQGVSTMQTWKWTNGERYLIKAVSNNGNPFSGITTDSGQVSGHSANEVVTLCGNPLITGNGNTTSPTGWGNADTWLDNTGHPTTVGHKGIGLALAAQLMQQLSRITA